MSRNILFSAAIAATLAFISTGATAGSVEAGNSVPVRFGDLDLKTDKGVATLKRRIDRAATEACGTYDMRDLKRMTAVESCRDFALKNAAHEIELAVAAAQKGESYASNAASIKIHAR